MILSTDNTYIEVLDKKGIGNANHEYRVRKTQVDVSTLHNAELGYGDTDNILATVSFQNGPIKENGVNGIQNEDLLKIVQNRLEGFQSGDFACLENQIALDNIKSAISVLEYRTKERKKRNVEGKNIK